LKYEIYRLLVLKAKQALRYPIGTRSACWEINLTEQSNQLYFIPIKFIDGIFYFCYQAIPTCINYTFPWTIT